MAAPGGAGRLQSINGRNQRTTQPHDSKNSRLSTEVIMAPAFPFLAHEADEHGRLLDEYSWLDLFPVTDDDHKRAGCIPAMHAGSLQDPAAVRDQCLQCVVGQVAYRYPALCKLGTNTNKITLTLTVSFPRSEFLDDADNWHNLLPSRCMHCDVFPLLQP